MKTCFTYLLLVIFLFLSCTKKENRLNNSISDQQKENIQFLIDSADSKRLKGKLGEALEIAQQAQKKAKELHWEHGLASAHNSISYIYLYQSEFEQSMTHAVEALKISEKIGDKENQASANLYIGYVNQSLEEYSEVLPYFKKSLRLRKELELPYEIGFSHSYIGNYYYDLQQFDSSRYHHREALKYRLLSNDKRSIADSYLLIGSTFLEENIPDSAETNFKKALNIYRTIDDKKRLGESYRNLAMLYKTKADSSLMQTYLFKAKSAAENINAKDNLLLIYKELANSSAQHKNFDSAYSYLEKHVQLKENMSGEETYRDAVKRIMAYKNEKEKKIKALEFQRQQEKQKFYVYLALFGLIFLTLFLVFLFNRLKISRRQNKIIQDQKNEVDKALGSLEEKNEEIMDSIIYAKRIQSALFPSMKELKELLPNSFIYYQPKDIVAGDFYYIKKTSIGTLIAVADCTGHGVPGALVSVVCINSLNRAINELENPEPGQVLDKTKEFVIKEFQKSEEDVNDGMDIALCLLQKDKLFYAGAQNPLWLIRKNTSEMEIFDGDKQPIGRFDKQNNFSQVEITIRPGDTFYLFSDGFKDQFGGKNGKKLKAKAFRDLLISMNQLPLKKQEDTLKLAFEKWRGNYEQVDDVCVMGIAVS